MADPVIRVSAPRELTEAERALLKAATGNDYTAVVPGIAGDNKVGLVNAEGADTLIFSESSTDFQLMAWDDVEIATIPRGTDPTVDRLIELAERVSGSPEEDAGQVSLATMRKEGGDPEPARRLTPSPELRAFVRENDVESALPVSFVSTDEPEAMQAARIKAFSRFYETLTPSMQKSVRVVDFRPTTEVGGYAQSQLGLARIGPGDVCSPTAYHEVAHLRTAQLSPEIEREWKAIEGDVYLDVPGHVFIRLSKTNDLHLERDELRRRGLIADYARANFNEDISVLTETIYSDPDEVKRAMAFSPRFAQKIEILYRHDYISAEQYLFLLADGPAAEAYRDERNVDPDAQVIGRRCGPESTSLGAEEGFYVSILQLFWK